MSTPKKDNQEKPKKETQDPNVWKTAEQWLAINNKIYKLEKQLEEYREYRSLLEKEHPFLGRLKGIIRAEAKVDQEVLQEGKSESKPQTPKKRKTKMDTEEPDPEIRKENELKSGPTKDRLQAKIDSARKNRREAEKGHDFEINIDKAELKDQMKQ